MLDDRTKDMFLLRSSFICSSVEGWLMYYLGLVSVWEDRLTETESRQDLLHWLAFGVLISALSLFLFLTTVV